MAEIIQASSAGIDFEKGVCAVCKKMQVNRWCDYIIKYENYITFFRKYEDFIEANRRGEQYVTCDLPMCSECAEEVSMDTHLCPHHYELQLQAQLPDEYQRMRQQREKCKIQMDILKPTNEEKKRFEGQMNLFE